MESPYESEMFKTAVVPLSKLATSESKSAGPPKTQNELENFQMPEEAELCESAKSSRRFTGRERWEE